MHNTWIFPYKPGSNSARELARELDVRRIAHRNSRFRGNPNKTIINWGATRLPEEVAKCRVINDPANVRRASNKLEFFRNAECRKPDWTVDSDMAREWAEDGTTVVARTVLAGHSGEGIVLVEGTDEAIPQAPLYTAYVPKKQEYRVHVFNGQVIDVQRKARRRDVADEDVNWKVRNNANGFVFARNGDALGDVPDDVLDQAVQAIGSIGLDFGAADVIFNDRQSLAYVLEVNTAPGLVGTTLTNYGEAFRRYVG